MRPLRAVVLVLLASCGAWWTADARGTDDTESSAPIDADRKQQAHRHYERAAALIREADFRAAIVELKQAYALSPHFQVQYNLGMAHVALGEPVEAEQALSLYLELGGAEIPEDRRTAVSEEIARQKQRIGRLTVRVEPPTATLLVDGIPVELAEGRAVVPLGVGRHAVAARFKGRRQAQRNLEISGQQELEVSLRLEHLPDDEGPVVGSLAVTCATPSVRATLDGKDVVQTPLDEPIVTTAGKHELLLQREGYRSHRQTIVVKPGIVRKVRCDMKPAPGLGEQDGARLSVASTEPGTRLFVDGHRVKEPVLLPRGDHDVRGERAGFHPAEQRITLAAGSAHTERLVMVPTDQYRADYVQSAQTRRWVAVGLGAGGLATMAATVAIHVWNEGRFNDWQNQENALNAATASGELTGTAAMEQYAMSDETLNDILAYDKVVIGGYILSGALLTAGLVVWLTGDDPSRYDDVRASIGPNGASATWRHEF